MTRSNKLEAEGIIRALKVEGVTNLWAGIQTGLKLFHNERDTGQVPAVLVLTDGQPTEYVI